MNETEVFNVYEDLEIPKNATCKKCIAEYKRKKEESPSQPVSIWQVGKKYAKAKKKVLFVGKVARSGEEMRKEKTKKYLDVTQKADELVKKVSYAYWSYTLEIAKEVFGEEDAWETIALTNAIKCDGGSTLDGCTKSQKKFCLDELGVLWKEIDVLKPDKIIFYTSWGYDEHIEKFSASEFEDVWDKKNTRRIGAYDMPWWHRKFNHQGREVHLLRIGHPERKKKCEFVKNVVDWIKIENK